jgi:phage-related protein
MGTAQNDDDPPAEPKPVRFVGSNRRDLRSLPQGVKRVFGQALFDAQTGKKHPDAKPQKGFGGAGVLEVVEDDRGSTDRAAYTVKFAGIVYVLHVFQKKSKTGTKTPAEEPDKVRARLKEAEKDYAEYVRQRKADDESDDRQTHPS